MYKHLTLLILITFPTATSLIQNFSAFDKRRDCEDKYADIIVSYGNRDKITFGRESSYLLFWETANDNWFLNKIIQRKAGRNTNIT